MSTVETPASRGLRIVDPSYAQHGGRDFKEDVWQRLKNRRAETAHLGTLWAPKLLEGKRIIVEDPLLRERTCLDCWKPWAWVALTLCAQSCSSFRATHYLLYDGRCLLCLVLLP